ncbi:arf-GAP with GTPase, ANK repeat and PH domain-containing protein 2 isoform X1 [Synchiropus splendidus]|uniref:arf-GAP with GTPase, ANK repeat and PH domain-containing protein 2 isoform X1 n=1 Tax=Synchiropus splendidus TaxID=270530 RepID=UPI00237DEDA7|nr:arf-GAP with GTPase, ANK repeat and PH domain-containing protein 2 isoform X1 [Synchiropus splendidus]
MDQAKCSCGASPVPPQDGQHGLHYEHMSGGAHLQQRTTYLISLTLVKVEAVEDEGGEPQTDVRQSSDGETRGLTGAEDRATALVASPQRTSPWSQKDPKSFTSDAQRSDVSTARPSERTGEERTLSAAEIKQSRPPSLVSTPPAEVFESIRTPTRTNLPMRPVGQRPVSLLKSQSSAPMRGRDSREGRERSPTAAQSLDRKDCRVPMRSPGPCRASWTEASTSEGWRDPRDQVPGARPLEAGYEGSAVMRDLPRKERLKSGSSSLPASANLESKPTRKGKSRTIDNSDLNSLSEDLGQAQHGPRTSAKDRKMLKFISGIFTKSSSGSGGSSSTPPSVFIQRDSSEEEVNIANSQDWSLSRSIPELRLGILGSLKSGKSSLVHKYVTGSYVALEKPDGERYKKEVLVDGCSHLLLIREEAGPPDAQFSSWVDAVILVFSLENESSFQELYQLYSQLCVHRTDIPVIVVGTQDKISSTNPRVIEDQRARQLCIDVRHSLFYETCATYGFNVDRVFSEAAQKIVAQKRQAALQAYKSLPNSPSHSGGSTPGSASFPGQTTNGPSSGYAYSLPSTPVISHRELRVAQGEGAGSSRSLKTIPRRPSLFKNRDSDKKSSETKLDPSSSRGAPIKQSILWKRSGSSLNKEWKKKYVTLTNNGTLCYHSSSSDYSQNIHGKEIDLLRVTVKVPGKRPPRAVAPAGNSAPPLSSGVNGVNKDLVAAEPSTSVPQLCPATLSVADERATALSPSGVERTLQRCPSSLSTKAQSVDGLEGAASSFAGKEPSQSSPMSDRKKNRRKKSMNQKGDAVICQAEAKRKMWKLKSFGSLRNINKTEEENADFIVVSFTGQTWHFEAQSLEERDSWVAAIESQILASLQACESGRNKARRSSQSEAVARQAIRNTKGNAFCVDCEAPNPTWASLNLGALICIECSGIHRNLGTHLSRVRSLDLDDWPVELTQVLAAIGNHMANSIWEGLTHSRTKPTPNASREERESWIRAKYEQRAFVPPLPAPADDSMPTCLLAAVKERDLPRLLLLLAHSSKDMINAAPAASHTALHAACQLGDVVMTQLLIWYGSDVKAKDSQGQTAMAMARKSGSKACVDVLLQHGCPNDMAPTSAAASVLSRRSSTASLGRPSSRTHVS